MGSDAERSILRAQHPTARRLLSAAQRSRRGGGVQRSIASAVTDATDRSSEWPHHVFGVGLSATR